jgi:glycosyltransferase involved in cell wall biosynthesis
MRIAQLAPPLESVPPRRYGGTERVVAVLTEELVRRGHEVTLFASADSHTSAWLSPTVDAALWHHPSFSDVWPVMTAAVGQVYRRADEFDVIHNHLGYLAYPAARACPTPTVTTLHGRLDLPELRPLFEEFPEMPLVSISDAQRAPVPGANWVATIHHGIDLRPLAFQPEPEGYLAFLGRVSPDKGLDTAIRAAAAAAVPLKIAARMPMDQSRNVEAQRDWRYYREEIEPLLSLPGIEYVGEVDDAERSAFLGNAAALLFPIRWPEPFGLVMPEALACGTPVIALRAGSAPEVVEHGVTGFVVDDIEGIVSAIHRLGELDRAACRAAAERRFSPEGMADEHEIVYERVIRAARGGWRASAAPRMANGE